MFMFKELFLDVTCLKLDRLYSNKTMGAVLYPVNSAFFQCNKKIDGKCAICAFVPDSKSRDRGICSETIKKQAFVSNCRKCCLYYIL